MSFASHVPYFLSVLVPQYTKGGWPGLRALMYVELRWNGGWAGRVRLDDVDMGLMQ